MRHILIYFFLLFGCASVQQPTGGQKDETPPKVISSSTDSAATNVTSTLFSFTFDEYIQLKQAVEKLIISPTQNKPPNISVKKKKVTIELNDSLLPKTTYTFQFNGAIVDINEGNPLDNYSFIYSSGSYIDSSTYNGTVINYNTKEVCSDCNIFLYSNYTDSTILYTKPEYLARTDKLGNFIFNNLPSKYFTAIVLQDKNKNLFFNKDEMVSLPKIIHADTNTLDTFYIFTNENTDNYAYSLIKTSLPGTYKLSANRPFDTDSLRLIFQEDTISYTLSFTKDTLTAYYTQQSDTLNITLLHKQDTAVFKNIIKRHELKYNLQSKAFSSASSLNISFKIPIQFIDQTKITLLLDSIPATFNIYRKDTCNFHIPINKLYSEANIILQPLAFTDIYNTTTKADTLIFTNKTEESTTLTLDIKGNKNDSYILYIKKQEKIIKEIYYINHEKLVFKDLKPGKYKVYILTDSNKNGIWETGNIFKLKKPEPITVSEDFELRQNWDKELLINVL